MSTHVEPEVPKIVVTLDEIRSKLPVLSDNAENLFFKLSNYRAEEALWKSKKEEISAELKTAIRAVGVDSIVTKMDNVFVRLTLSKPKPKKVTSEEKLRMNMMKLGKLDAEQVETIFAASQDDVPAAEGSLTLTMVKDE